MAKIGYARASSKTQDLSGQIELLIQEGCSPDNIYSEKESGKSTDNRTQLEAAIKALRHGDILIATKLDRIARSISDLWEIIKRVQDKGADFKLLDGTPMDTTTPGGKMMITVMGAFAQFERDLINSRCSEGRERALKNGVKFGRPADLSNDKKQELLNKVAHKTDSKMKLAKEYGISRTYLYQLLKEAA